MTERDLFRAYGLRYPDPPEPPKRAEAEAIRQRVEAQPVQRPKPAMAVGVRRAG